MSEDATTEPVEQTTEHKTAAPVQLPTESESQPTEQPSGGLPWPLILAGLAVLGVGCVVLVVLLIVKYFRAQKA